MIRTLTLTILLALSGCNSAPPLPQPNVSTPQSDTTAAQASRDYWMCGRVVTPIQRTFYTHCLVCHGADGADMNRGPMLRPEPYDAWSESALARFIGEGNPARGMPSFKARLTDADRLQLARLIQAGELPRGDGVCR